MTDHQWVMEIEYGDFICVKCLAVKDTDFAQLGCGTKAARDEARREDAALKANFDDVCIRLAIHQGYPLEKRLWPRLRKELDDVYKRATAPAHGQ